MAAVVSSTSPSLEAVPLTIALKETHPDSPNSLDEHRNSMSSGISSLGERIDSGVEVSPVSADPPTRTHTYTSFESRYVVYPPLITGHGRLVRARQTVPAWMGVLIVVGGFTMMVGFAIYV